jgi:Holliday junction resolvase RusA-like endonuclease
MSTRRGLAGWRLMPFGPSIRFFVEGDPGTKGSVNAFVVGKGRNRHAVVVNNSMKAKPWAKAVSAAAEKAYRGDPLDVPVFLFIIFYLKRPKSHYRSNGALKPNAPVYVPTKPDGDKLERCAWDALTGIIFKDDSLVVSWYGQKRYSDGKTGASFLITWRR